MLHIAPRTSASIGLIVLVSSLAFALVQLEVTIVNVALPRIGAELRAPVALLQWVVDAYALTFAVLLLSAGLLGDRLGARRVYRTGMAVFCLASLACGWAPTAGGLIGARALQGIGAAAMLPNSLALLNHACGHDPKLRAKAVGWWTAAGSIAIAAGPIVAGLLLGLGSWRSIFLINLPVCVIGLWLTRRIPETDRNPDRGSLDCLGQALAILALCGLVGAVIEARPLGPAHPLVLGGLALFLVSAPLFAMVEGRSVAPMLPIRLFRTAAFGTALAYGIVCNFTYYGALFVLSLYLQRVLGYSATGAGLAYLPLTATFFGVNVVSGWLVGRFGPRWPMILGALVDALGFALLLNLGPGTAFGLMVPAFVLVPAGMGTGVPAMTISVLASVEKSQAGIASAALNAARQAAGALGVATFGAFVGETPGGIVGGLHGAALLSIPLLCGVSALAFLNIRAIRPSSG